MAERGVPVLVYHVIRENAEGDYPQTVIPLDKFEEQMRYLYDNGFVTISLDDLVAYMKGSGFVPDKAVVLNFDDGWKGILDVVPILNRYNFKASIFVISEYGIGGPYLNWRDISDLSRHLNFQIGSHSMTHTLRKDGFRKAAYGERFGDEVASDLLHEITGSKRKIERKIGRPVRYFAWPGGAFDEDLMMIAKNAGYEALLTVADGFNRRGDDIYRIKRTMIDGRCDLGTFQQVLRDAKYRVCDGAWSGDYADAESMIRNIDAAALLKGVEPALVKAIVKVESDFDPSAVSHKGAVGIMQVLPESAGNADREDLLDPEKNLDIGIDIFKGLLDKYQGDVSLALAAYNAGEGAVDRYNGIPPFPETQSYVTKVMDSYRKFDDAEKYGYSVVPAVQSVTAQSPTVRSTFAGPASGSARFGYDLFRGDSGSFAPQEQAPVGRDYLIGPGDELRVTVWGKVEGQWNLIVDRDGAISLPKIGVLGVSGLTFQELREVLQREFAKYYNGFQMNVTMGALRTIRVYVVGNAQKPGSYRISALSGLVNALFEVGGPSETGTLRDIQLKRGDRTIVRLDLYDFLLRGDKSQDVRLQPGDVIFIPPVGATAAIVGHARSPAVYELKGRTTISGLVAMAGGVSASGYLQRVQVERVFRNEAKVIADTNLKDLGGKNDLVLQDGDVVRVFPITDKVVNAVTLRGNVTRAGQRQWYEGMRVSDMLPDPDKDLLPESYFDQALIERYVFPDYHREVIFFDLGEAIFGKDQGQDMLLQPYDTVTVYSKWDFLEKPMVEVSGAVQRPGEYELRPNMRVSDLVNLAGGMKRYALPEGAELTRVHVTPEGPVSERRIVDLAAAMSAEGAGNIALMEDDYLVVPTVPEWEVHRMVHISGEVRFPGDYTIKKGEKLSSLIERAGGFTDSAYLPGAVFTRVRAQQLQQERLDEMVERLDREVLGVGAGEAATSLTAEDAKIKEFETKMRGEFIDRLRKVRAKGRMALQVDHPERLAASPYDIELEEGDSLAVPENPRSIQVVGAVYNQSTFIYTEDDKPTDYIAMAGGYTENADTDKVYVLKVDGTVVRGIGKKLESGDTIVVPEKMARISWMRDVKNLTQILYQIAVTAGVLIVAF